MAENKKGFLRTAVEAAIEKANGNTELAAKEVLKVLEQKIGLHGNGWFDDDDEMLNIIFE